MDIDERLEESIDNKYIQDDKGKNEMKLTVEESFYILKRKDFNSYVEEKAIEVLLSELDKDNNIISDLQNEVTLKQCELEKKNKIIDEIKNDLKEHIKFCKQEASGSLNNEICHISLKFDKSLLDIIESRG